MRKYISSILFIVWGMIQFIALMLLGVGGENTWLIYGLVISDIGMMCVIISLMGEVEVLKGE